MAGHTSIKLNWFQQTATVLEKKKGSLFEIGTLVLDIIADAIIGFTYYHHILPTSETPNEEIPSQKNKLIETIERINELNRNYPEISEENLNFDDSERPELLDLAIFIRFVVPFLSNDPYQDAVLEKVQPYVKLLGSIHLIEILKE